MKKRDYSAKEFFELLKDKLSEIKIINHHFESTYDLYNTCCSYNSKTDTYLCYQAKIENLLNNKKGKKDFKKLLMEVLGPRFFDYSKEEQENLQKQNIATSKMLPEIFEGAIGFKYKNIEVPKNYDEFVVQIENIIEILNNDSISDNEKQKYANPLVIIENIIASRYKEFINSYDNQKLVINRLNEIFDLYNKKKEINIDDNVKLLAQILNENIEYTITHNDSVITNKDVGFGEVTLSVIEDYNKELKEKSKEKELNKKINSYYKDLVKTPVEVMKNEQFPPYSDNDVEKLYEGLINKISDASLKNEELCTLLTLTQVMYCHYFGSKYYKDSEEKTKIK